jgi:hypothetical protein
MSKDKLSESAVYPSKNWLAPTIFIITAIAWLSASSSFLQGLLNKIATNNIETFFVWSATFLAVTFSILVGAFFSDKFHLRSRFLLVWTTTGIMVSFMPLIDIKNTLDILLLSSFFVATWGFGLPACMAYFADNTIIEKRAKIGGAILFLSILLGAVSRVLLASEDNITCSFYLACLMASNLIAFPMMRSYKGNNTEKKASSSFVTILKEKSFILYLVPWTLFVLVNDLFAPIATMVQGEEFVYSITIAGTVLAGVFSILGGFFADLIGRRPVVIIGFVLLGLGYAVLGIFPLSLFSWYFYTIVDSIAWGMLFAIFLITLWGDLAGNKSSEKYYALGLIPFAFSNFVGLTAGPSIADVVPTYAIFSFVAIFLFLAVLPLMYAPETLPEKKIRERELKQYIEKAKKVKEKYA